jgi:Peptidase C80 family
VRSRRRTDLRKGVTPADTPDDNGVATQARVFESANSFASRFHRILKTDHGITAPVHARIYNVIVDETGDKHTAADGDPLGLLGYRDPFSKVLFVWEGEKQVRYWVKYGPKPVDATANNDSGSDDEYGGLPVIKG